MINLENATVIRGKEIRKSLMNGHIITWNDKYALIQPRLYKYNNSSMEYSDDGIHWKNQTQVLMK